ncbi:GTPase activating protein (BUD2/CLA2) [Purpureocillium lavendulum]|uniref:GTPase activating protein (BUD2/CLA2) n=1 Tax=Purpureocillium lavendulum TaxID=1247861 RepID=A0AB34FDA0_9HYPO|nr:GTPase activating protein (BUD2/CLA2) [Purpureocillium lavendulum]
MSPSGMEGQAGAAGLSPGGDSDSADWPRPPPPPPRPVAVPPRPQRQAQTQGSQPSASSLELQEPAERSGAAGIRSAFRAVPDTPSGSLRAVTPDLIDGRILGASAFAVDSSAVPPPIPRDLGPSSQQGSPMAILGAGSRRQGMVFHDSFDDSYESNGSSPPLLPTQQYQHQQAQYQQQPQQRQASSGIRPRTRTMDAAMLKQRVVPIPDQRHRMGSVSSSGSQPLLDDQRSPPAPSLESIGYSISSNRHTEPSTPSTPSKSKDKKSNKRLLKRQSSRPTSPGPSPIASVDSLPTPVITSEPVRLMSLMKALNGRMRGEIEYQGDAGGAWSSGYAYIDDEKGYLMCDSGQNSNGFTTLISDLRGCRVLPVEYPESGKACMELVTAEQQATGESILLLRPMASDEWNLWLAALLCWQQVRPSGVKMANGSSSSPVAPVRPGLRRQGQSDGTRGSNIIKVGTIMLWDKGPATTPRDISQRSSTRDPRSQPASWRRVSCILHENGEFKLLMENDITVLSVIQLSQLSRCAIQQLDHTVLDEEYCIAIFPLYSSTATQLSIFRPVYLAVDSRVNFEVWFVLLRAFAVPDIYKLDNVEDDSIQEVSDLDKEHEEETFRIEKTVGVRVTEAKIRARTPESTQHLEKSKDDGLVGNYLAEVTIDGEVRARTTTKMATKNPFWREDCEFVDLPPSVQELSIVLKRVEVINSKGSASANEVCAGTVNIVLDQLERSKDHEEWLPIIDDRQQTVGSMLVKVSHAEHIALLTKEYEALSELLHRFPSGLTTLISAALPGQLRRLSDTFLNIFQGSGCAGDWLMALVEDEIDGIGSQNSIKKFRFSSRLKSNESMESATDRELIVRDMTKSLAGEANLLFRGNTLLTQSLEFHMRRLGREYLEDMLQVKIKEINDINPDCEVDPSKLPHHTSSAELDQRWNRLILWTTEIWQCIAGSANELPSELRHILKYIRAVAEDRYGDFLRTVTYTAVSGFLFLRFICPAILSPKLFCLLRDHPRQRAQRTLTLIAKVLQKMANMSTFGKREEWMEPMNKFLTTQRPVFREYIDQVCSIPADRAVKSAPPSYSTPVTILGRLSPAAREGFPSLPYLIDPARSFASLVKLWVDLCPADIKKGQVDGDLAIFSELCHALQKRADACLAKVESVRATEISSRGAEQLAETLEQASLIESLSTPHGLPTVVCEIDRAPGSSGSDGGDEGRRRSKELRRRDDSRKASGLRHASGAGGTVKGKNGKVGRTILSGIMRIGGRAESPDAKQAR